MKKCNLSDSELAGFLLRLVMGALTTWHGVAHIFAMEEFSQYLYSSFTMIPQPIVVFVAWLFPFALLLAGLSILFGYNFRQGVILGVVTLLVLTIGQVLLQDYAGEKLNLVYIFGMLALLLLPHSEHCSISSK